MIGGLFCCLLFLCVPETFWDRSSRPESMSASRSHCNASEQKGESYVCFSEPTKSTIHQAGRNSEATLGGPVSPAGNTTMRSPSSFHGPIDILHAELMLDESRPKLGKSENIDAASSCPRTKNPPTAVSPVLWSRPDLSGNILALHGEYFD
jgi:hypothetical protein